MLIFNKVTIVGVGLIGGSVGLALKKRRLAKKIVGAARHASTLTTALKMGAIDEGTQDVREAAKDADLILFATPVASIPKLIEICLPKIKRGALLSDVGSTKEEITRKIEKILPQGIHFVGAHPLAGSEKNGVEYARADLFRGSLCLLAKTKKTRPQGLRKLAKLWQALGARTAVVSCKAHDRILSQISHLPHLAAVALIDAADKNSIKFAASGFKDATRIAAGEPVMWRDICITNKKEILHSIDKYIRAMSKLRTAVKCGDSKVLMRQFTRARRIRGAI